MVFNILLSLLLLLLVVISKERRSCQQFYSTKRSVVVLAAVAAAAAVVVVVGGTSNLGILPDPDLRRTYEPTDRTTDGLVLFQIHHLPFRVPEDWGKKSRCLLPIFRCDHASL